MLGLHDAASGLELTNFGYLLFLRPLSSPYCVRLLHLSVLDYHCSLQSSNLLLDKDFTVKVADFGLTRIVSSPTAAPMTGQCGTFQVRCGHVGGRLCSVSCIP